MPARKQDLQQRDGFVASGHRAHDGERYADPNAHSVGRPLQGRSRISYASPAMLSAKAMKKTTEGTTRLKF